MEARQVDPCGQSMSEKLAAQSITHLAWKVEWSTTVLKPHALTNIKGNSLQYSASVTCVILFRCYCCFAARSNVNHSMNYVLWHYEGSTTCTYKKSRLNIWNIVTLTQWRIRQLLAYISHFKLSQQTRKIWLLGLRITLSEWSLQIKNNWKLYVNSYIQM
jgi:hypothetical protein